MMGRIPRRGVIAAGFALAAPRLAMAQGQQLAIGTGTTGGVYYPLGGALANLISRQIPGMSATVEVTGGSVGNLQLLGANRVGMVFTQVDAAVDAIRGNDRFRGRPVPARAIAVIYTNRMQIVSVASTGIKSIPDMKGKRISTGAPGSATEVMDFRARERLSPAESTNAVKDGKLDAYMFVSGIPTSAITDLGASPGVQIQMIDHDNYTAEIVKKYGPVYFNEVIPAGTYPGQTTDNRQMSVANVLAVREDMPAELVTQLIRLTWEGREDLARTHAEARNFKLEGQKTAAAGIPWHPAAEAYWRSVGANLA
jgi:TRAP transporter TAXI family solute receptor